jgi:hypothetical protein
MDPIAGRPAQPPQAHNDGLNQRTQGAIMLSFDQSLSDARVNQLLARANRAWQFDANAYRWSNGPGRANVVVLPDAAAGGGARAEGSARVVIPFSALDQPDFDGVLAHELSHLQFNNHADPGKWPRFLNEGQAYFLGKAFRDVTGGSSKDDAMRESRERALTRDRAKVVFDEGLSELAARARKTPFQGDPRANGWRNVVGLAFMHFLTARNADVMQKLGQAGQKVRANSSLDDAFQAAFGSSFAELESAFLASLPA